MAVTAAMTRRGETMQTQMLRQIARRLFDAAVAAADPGRALAHALEKSPFPEPGPAGRRIVLAIGKAAPAMMSEALRHAGSDTTALVVTHHENAAQVPGARVLRAGHPVPDTDGARAALAVEDLLRDAGANDRIIALISGGGSALLPAPVPGLTLDDKAAVSRVLLAGGLDIGRMNLVRQHLSRLKGGGPVRLAHPAPVTAYILSDVIGDDLRVIASGPTVSPVGTRAEARDMLRCHGLWDSLPEAARQALTRPDDDGPLPRAYNHLIGSNRMSLEAMQVAAAQAGLDAHIVNDHLTGDVGDAARTVLDKLSGRAQPTALLFGGETTVDLQGSGLGGRNQELALRVALAAPKIGSAWAFLSGGTDGRDGPTDAAGGIVDAGTAARIATAGGNAQALLGNNDSHAALGLAGDLLITQATGTNVADVQALLIAPQSG